MNPFLIWMILHVKTKMSRDLVFKRFGRKYKGHFPLNKMNEKMGITLFRAGKGGKITSAKLFHHCMKAELNENSNSL